MPVKFGECWGNSEHKSGNFKILLDLLRIRCLLQYWKGPVFFVLMHRFALKDKALRMLGGYRLFHRAQYMLNQDVFIYIRDQVLSHHCPELRCSIKQNSTSLVTQQTTGPLFIKNTPSYRYKNPYYRPKTVWRPSQIYKLKRHRLTGIGIPFINLRWSDDRLRFIMRIPIPIRLS